jgi:hypothetical protein
MVTPCWGVEGRCEPIDASSLKFGAVLRGGLDVVAQSWPKRPPGVPLLKAEPASRTAQTCLECGPLSCVVSRRRRQRGLLSRGSQVRILPGALGRVRRDMKIPATAGGVRREPVRHSMARRCEVLRLRRCSRSHPGRISALPNRPPSTVSPRHAQFCSAAPTSHLRRARSRAAGPLGRPAHQDRRRREAPGCGPGGRGFEFRRSPFTKAQQIGRFCERGLSALPSTRCP